MDPNHKVYDDHDEQPVTGPALHNLENGKSAADKTDSGRLDTSGLHDAIGGRLQALEGHVQSLSGISQSGGLFRPDDLGGRSIKAHFSDRRKAAGGGIIALLVAAGITIFSIISGPGQTVQLSQMLQRAFNPSKSAASQRIDSLLRNSPRIGAQDIGETRLNTLGRQFLRPVMSELSDMGVNFDTDVLGNATKVTINTDALSKRFPELRDIPSKAGQAEWISKNLLNDKISPGQLTTTGDIKGYLDGFRARTFEISRSNLNISDFNGLKNNLVRQVSSGDLTTAINTRVVGKYLGIHGLFTPLDVARDQIRQKAATRAELVSENDSRIKTKILDPIAETVRPIQADLKDKLSGDFGKYVGRSLVATYVLCTVRNAAGDAVKYNQEAIVAPAMAGSLDLVAVGDQVRSNKVGSLNQLGGVTDSLTDDQGKNVWQGKALQAMSGENPTGSDLPTQYAQAFSNTTTADRIQKAVQLSIPGTSIDLSGVACNKAGLIAQAAANVIFFAVNLPTDGGAFAAVAYTGEQAAVGAAVGGTAYLFEKEFTNIVSDKAAVGVLRGPLGGNLAAYGIRAAANVSALASGGVVLSNSQVTQYAAEQEKSDKQAFQSKSFVARVFNPEDYYSLTGKLVQHTNSDFTDNARLAVMSIPHFFGSMLGNVASLFTKKTDATSTYHWAMPQIGIPKTLLNDPSLANPYDNANKVGALLDGSQGQKYRDRAMTCFGDNVNKDSGSWNVIATKKVNTDDNDYQSTPCGDLSDPNWKRMILFVFDTRNMLAIACLKGDDQSCSDDGYDTAGSSAASNTAATNGSVDQGSAADLAKKLLAHQQDGSFKCDDAGGCDDLNKVAQGQDLATGDGCRAKTLDPRVIQVLLYIIENGGFKIGTFAFCSDHPFDTPRGHSGGFAVDISSVNGASLAQDTTLAQQEGLKLDQYLSTLPSSLNINQLITYGYGQHYYRPMAELQKYGGKLCKDTCVSTYTLGTENQHTNHIHVGF